MTDHGAALSSPILQSSLLHHLAVTLLHTFPNVVLTRGLQVAFRRHLDVTPRERLRQARLDGAHRDLVYADPHTTTVASVARRWGFVHLGHFATAYPAAYGERPAQTLAR